MDYAGSKYEQLSRAVELFDFTVFDFPNATLTDTSTEEIELDQALSLAGRRGRRYFGAQYQGILFDMFTELLTDPGVLLEETITLASRTGAFNIDDPELIDRLYYASILHTAGTNTEASLMQAMEDLKIPPRGDIYVAPRLFHRVTNDLDVTIATDTQFVRLATIAQPLSFQTFIELLERFADVTLL